MPFPSELICLIAARQLRHPGIQLLYGDRLSEKRLRESRMKIPRLSVVIEAAGGLNRPQGRNRAVIVDRQLQPEPGSHIAMQSIGLRAAVVQLRWQSIETAAGDRDVDVITTCIAVPRGKPAVTMMTDRQSRQYGHGDPQP
ncbi:hypothetical protein KTN05_16765 [Paracoccus sp. Z118]|nr:hypothetical protein [Paracoccus sp. Z118]MBV0893455.1 hypothetical protein [Paracoccus sp. Z118]